MDTVTPHKRATRWKPQRYFLRSSIPADLADWLLDRESLTLRLQQLCPGKSHHGFRVQVSSQLQTMPRLDETQALAMQPRELAEIFPGQAVFAAATAHTRHQPASIWGRRSVFWLSGKPLLVSEVFLPDFPAASPMLPSLDRQLKKR